MIGGSKVPAGVMKVTSAGMPPTINWETALTRANVILRPPAPTNIGVHATPISLRAVITLYDVYGWSMTEVAACLGITPSTAKARAHRAHLLLRQRLGEFMPRRTI